MRFQINDNLTALLFARAKRENKKIEAVIHEILSQALWNEPGVLFKGRNCRVEPDLFGQYIPNEPSAD